MKRKELTELRNKETVELKKLLDKKSEELVKLSVKMKVSKEKNLKSAKILRHDIAQIQTIMREKEILEDLKNAKESSEK